MTVHYTQEDGAVIPKRVHTVVISAQHDDDVSLEEQKRVLKEEVIEAVVPARYLDENTVYHLQPSGRFVIGGPQVTTCPRPAEATEASYKPHMETSLLYVVAHFPAKSKKVLFTKKNTMVILSGRRWSDRQEDHRGHIRRMGGPRGRSLLREGLHQGGPLGRLRRPLGGEVSGESQTVQEGAGAGDITQSIKYKQRSGLFLRVRSSEVHCLSVSPGGLRHRSGPPTLHLTVHIRLLSEDRQGAAADRQ